MDNVKIRQVDKLNINGYNQNIVILMILYQYNYLKHNIQHVDIVEKVNIKMNKEIVNIVKMGIINLQIIMNLIKIVTYNVNNVKMGIIQLNNQNLMILKIFHKDLVNIVILYLVQIQEMLVIKYMVGELKI